MEEAAACHDDTVAMPGLPRLRLRTWAPAVCAVVLAGTTSALLLRFGPPGVDLAAHEYLRALFVGHGLVVWDNRWYDGRYPFLGYSVLYYPLAAGAGVAPLEWCSVVLAAGGYGVLATRRFGRAAPASVVAFGACWGLVVLSGAAPFLLGAALALWALAVLPVGSRPGPVVTAVFSVLALASLAASALAFLGLAMLVGAGTFARFVSESAHGLHPLRRLAASIDGPSILVALGVIAELVVLRAFPSGGWYPFWPANLAEVLAATLAGVALAGREPRRRVLLVAAAGYGALCAGAFFVRSDLGANVARLRDCAIAIAVLMGSLRRWRPRALTVAVVVGATWWNLWPVASEVRAAPRAEATAAYWAPAVTWLRQHLDASYRVEAVDTAGHWPADRVAGAGIPLVRGWFRQDDMPTNELLYRSGPLRPSAYRRWLRSQGVQYVLLTRAPLDFSSVAEAALLRSGRSGLTEVWHDGRFSVYAVPSPVGIVEGPGGPSVERLGVSEVVVRLPAPGRYHVAIHYSPYWSASTGCLSRAPGGMTRITVGAGATVELRIRVTPRRLLDAVVGSAQHCR